MCTQKKVRSKEAKWRLLDYAAIGFESIFVRRFCAQPRFCVTGDVSAMCNLAACPFRKLQMIATQSVKSIRTNAIVELFEITRI
jgi:hypothetical protein